MMGIVAEAFLDMTKLMVAVFPDNFAKYRVAAFRRIAQIENIDLTIFSSTKGRSRGNVAIAEPGIDFSSDDSFSVIENRNYLIGPHILWTEGLLGSVVRKNFDVVIAWGEVQNISVWLALLLGAISRRSVVIWTHGMYGSEGWLKKRLRVLQCRLAKAVFLYGEKARDRLESAGVPAGRLHVVYNSLDYKGQTAMRQSISPADVARFRERLVKNGSEATKLLLFVGRINVGKRIDIAIHGMEQLRERGKDYRLVVIGDGPMLASHKELVSKLDLDDRVVFLPPAYSEEELAGYFMSADLAVCPGAIGLLAVHAYAYGLAVCTHNGAYTRQGPEHEIIAEGETGFIFKENDVEDFIEKIEEWFGRHRDQTDIVEACIRRVESKYNPEVQARIVESALKRIACS